ncbi:MAG: hypothetical protein U1F56_20915 [Rubrivivax sp.]
MNAPTTSTWLALDSRLEPARRAPDPLERWVTLSAMALVTVAGMAAVLL